jgi:hypothetical protein
MSKIYASMDELVKEFIDKATNKQCGKYKLPESTCRNWTNNKGSKYHYHNSGVYVDQSTLNFAYDDYNDVYQDYFAKNVSVNFIENADAHSNYPSPLKLHENGQQDYTYEAMVDSSSTTSNSVSYTNKLTVGVKVKVGGDDLSVEGSVEVSHSKTTSQEQSNTTGQSSKGVYTWHWDESPDMYPDGFTLLWGVNHYKLQTNPNAQLETTYTVDLNKGLRFAINCGYTRSGKTHHTTLFEDLMPADLGYSSNKFIVKVPTSYNVDYIDSFPTIMKKPLDYI